VSSQHDRLRVALADRYRLERELGAGGMATVYLAQDLRHDREVAIKVLHPDLAAALGAERFVAEIKTTAKLTHPHILPLLDSGNADGFLYYVMPVMTGETLRSRLQRERQLPIPEVVRLAKEVASALDYAHRQGVIHRDIKPENILLHEGQALVADFGIALAVQSAGGARMTQTGLSLGTPQYMSPEQAMGERTVDARSDVYALGAVTYEMLTGDAPFTGSSVQAIVAKVLAERPTPPHTVRDTVSPALEQAVLTALAKLPADRFASAKEFAEALEAQGASSAVIAARRGASTMRDARGAGAWRLAAAVLALVSLGALGFAARERRVARAVVDAAPVIRAHFDLPRGTRIADALVGGTVAVSQQGDLIAFTTITASGYQMHVRRVDELEARPLGGPNIAGRNLTFSPDGKWIAFTEGNRLQKVRVDGGAVEDLGTTGGTVPYGLAWSASDTIYIGSFSGIFVVQASGSAATRLVGGTLQGLRNGQRWPLALPSGRAIAYARGNNASDVSRLSVYLPASATSIDYDIPLAIPVGVVDDHLVYVTTASELMAVRIDLETGRPLSEPLQIEDGVLIDATAGAKAALSASGTLVYIRGRSQFQPVLLGANGAESPVIEELRSYSTPRYSPDGRRIAVTVFAQGASNIWLLDVARRTFSPLTSDGTSMRPEWSADSRHVVFISQQDGQSSVMWQLADGSASAEVLYQPELEVYEALVSPDAKWLVFRTAPGVRYPRDILAVQLDSARDRGAKVTELVTGPSTESLPRFSPDGRWLSYQSNESGRFEVYVRPFPENGARVPVSVGGGTEPIWARDGSALFYRGPLGEVMRVGVSTRDGFAIGDRRMVGKGDYLTDASHADWDIAPDGRFLLLKRAGDASQLLVVHNWARELREKTSARR